MDEFVSKDYIGTESVNPLLTDFYQFSMIYAYWKNGRSNEHAVFNMYLRKCPFGLDFCVFGGVDECFEYLRDFKFTDEHISFLRTQFPFAEDDFFTFLQKMDMSDVKIYGFNNGEFVFANEPLFTIDGPLSKVQIIESTLLNLTNYPTLIATLAMKIKITYENMVLVEDGSINSQSPNGAYLGVKYACVGGVDRTTNLLACRNFNLEIFIKTASFDFNFDEEITNEENFILCNINLLELISSQKIELTNKLRNTLLSAILTFNSNIFTYEITSNSREDVLNFVSCSFGLLNVRSNHEITLILNYAEAIFDAEQIRKNIIEKFMNFGINIDMVNFKLMVKYNTKMLTENFSNLTSFINGILLGPEFIVSSTHPAVGMVYKINQINDKPCIKFSEEKSKQTIPGFKYIIRLFDNQFVFADFLCLKEEILKYENLSEIWAYRFDEFSTKCKLVFTSYKIMNNLIFENNSSLVEKLSVNNLRKRALENYQFYIRNNLTLYISEGIRNIIVYETEKIS